MCILDDYSRHLDKVIRNHLATRAHYVEQVESYCKDKGDNDELLLQEKCEDKIKLLKFVKKYMLKSKIFHPIIVRK